MGIEVVEDTCEGASLTETKEGFVCSRRFLVHGILEGQDQAYTAMQEGKVPKRSDPHPSIPFIYCDSRNAQVVSGSRGIVEVVCSYKRPTRSGDRSPNNRAKPSIEIGSSVVTVSTNKDFEGLPMETVRRSNTETTTTQRVLAQIQAPQTVMRLQRKEDRSPHAKSMEYVGTVNAGLFFDGDERTWLCTRIEGRSDDGGESYLVSYEFQFNQDQWDYDAYFIGSDNLPIPTTADPAPIFGSEHRLFQIYRTSDFDKLHVKTDGDTGDGIGGGITGL